MSSLHPPWLRRIWRLSSRFRKFKYKSQQLSGVRTLLSQKKRLLTTYYRITLIVSQLKILTNYSTRCFWPNSTALTVLRPHLSWLKRTLWRVVFRVTSGFSFFRISRSGFLDFTQHTHTWSLRQLSTEFLGIVKIKYSRSCSWMRKLNEYWAFHARHFNSPPYWPASLLGQGCIEFNE